MVTEDILAAQKSFLKGKYLKSYNNFMTCQKSYHKRPELVLLSNGRHYVDGLDSCRCGYCYHCVRVYLYKASLKVAKVREYVRRENLRPSLLTLTVPHRITDELKHLKLVLDKVTRGLLATSGKTANKLIKRINQNVGSTGYILRNEIGWNGINGWNTHAHVVSLQSIDFSETQKNQIVDEYTRLLEDSGLHLSRLDRYNIERKERLVCFSDNFVNLGYLTKYDESNSVNLAVTQPEKYIEFAQSFNITQKIPIVKFKNGLKSKISKVLNLSGEKNQTVRELKRIQLPESLIGRPLEEVEKWLI